MKQAATAQLLADGRHPFGRGADGREPSVWGQDSRKVFLSNSVEVRDRIVYVELNPEKEG
jgi:hypothetical protein